MLAPNKPHIRWEFSPARQNRAHSEQPSQKTGPFPYRLANSLLNAVLPKYLHRAAFATDAFERGPLREVLDEDPRPFDLGNAHLQASFQVLAYPARFRVGFLSNLLGSWVVWQVRVVRNRAGDGASISRHRTAG